MLNTMISSSGYWISQLNPGESSSTLSVPFRRSSIAIHRNEITDAGNSQANSTRVSTTARTAGAAPRSIQASANPSTVCPMIAEPKT